MAAFDNYRDNYHFDNYHLKIWRAAMRAILSLMAILVFMVASTGFAEPPVMSMSVDCNWGQLTMESTPLGDHASDPSGDGLGPEPRVGLANIIERGNLQAVCEFLEGP